VTSNQASGITHQKRQVFFLIADFRSLMPGQSTVTPLALIGAAHFSILLLRNCPRYSGVAQSSETITAPSPLSRSRTAGVFIAWTACSFLTTSAGAPFGRKIAFQV
jgi:hypothetical protein